MLRCQFLCYVLKTLFFIKIALKLSYFCNKFKIFERWRLHPQTLVPPATGSFVPRPKNYPPPLRVSGYAPGPIFSENLFLGFHLNSGKKKCSIFGEDLFFALHLICSPEKNRGRGSSPPMLKIGKNWGKLQVIPPQCSKKMGTPDLTTDFLNLEFYS